MTIEERLELFEGQIMCGTTVYTWYYDGKGALLRSNCPVNPNLSKAIQICCDYIEQNAEGDLSIESIAKRVGYTEYYLSRKFKEEVHVSINNYIKIARVERAKFLLGCTSLSIQDIAERLHFCSRSYFGEAFRSIVGCSPVEYRQNYKKG